MKKLLKHGDLIVPYVAAWSSEKHAFIRRDKYAAGAPAIFSSGMRGKGTPVFGKMHEGRQREVMFNRLCQVCAAPLKRHFAIDRPAAVVREKDVTPLIVEPPVCAGCALYSVETCPGIKRFKDHPDTLFMELQAWTLVQQWLGPAGDDGELDKVLKKFGKPAVGYLKAMVEKATVFNYEGFVAQVREALGRPQ